MSTKINVRSPFYVFIGDNDLITSAQTPTVAFDCTKAALYGQSVSLAGVVTPAISNLTTVVKTTSDPGATVSSPTSRDIDYNVLIPAGYSNTGDGSQTISCTVTSTQPATLTTQVAASTTFNCSHFTSAITTQFAVSDQGVITAPVASGITIISLSHASYSANNTGSLALKTISVSFTVPTGYANTGATLSCSLNAQQPAVVDPNTYYLMYPCSVPAGQSITTIIGYSTVSTFTSGQSWNINGTCYNISGTTSTKDTTHNLGGSAQYATCTACQAVSGSGSTVLQASVFYKLKLCSNGSIAFQTTAISNQTFGVGDRVVDGSGNFYRVMGSSLQTYNFTEVSVTLSLNNGGCPATTTTVFYSLFACGSFGNTTNTVGYPLGTFGSGQYVEDSSNNRYVVISYSTSDPGGAKISVNSSSANSC